MRYNEVIAGQRVKVSAGKDLFSRVNNAQGTVVYVYSANFPYCVEVALDGYGQYPFMPEELEEIA